MNKLKAIFKKDKDESDSYSSSHPTSQTSSNPVGSQAQSYQNQAPSSQAQTQNYQSQAPPSQAQDYQSRDPPSQAQNYQSQAPPSQAQNYQSQTPQNQTQTSSQQSASGGGKQGVLLETNYGNITIFLFSEECPKTAKNFAGLADAGKYNGVIFHRIIPDFMIQGGDPTGSGRGGESIYGGKFEDEFVGHLKHTGKGILSMANSGPATNGSQFFITLAATPHLNGKHTVFGKVVDGMDVVDRIGAARTDHGDRPLEDIMIVRAQSFLV